MTNTIKKRPPIVAVMGHVDHGKTTLLDYIRKTNVAGREAGGITQSIGAYEIEVPQEPKSRESEANRGILRQAQDDFASTTRKITFIDTPGHEAFAKMREHGATVADIAILVIAADDSVKPQTKEALEHILKTKTPYIVAINKIDKANANIEKTKQDLGQIGVYLEGYGGNISYQEISAKTGEGVNALLDLILLAADLENLTYEEEGNATGIITSCYLDQRRGLVVGAILKNGKLEIGQNIGTATAKGKIKSLENFLGKKTTELIPSAPALIIGFLNAPLIGEKFTAGKNIILEHNPKLRIYPNASKNIDEKIKIINLILKADEAGSLEALEDLIGKISKETPLKTIDSSIGNIYENDAKTAESGNAIIIGFRTKADSAALNMIQAKKIIFLSSPIIYELEKELKIIIKKLNPKELRTIEILAVFGKPKGKEKVVGGKIILGPIKNQENFEIWHSDKLIGKGKILNLQSGRKDIAQAETGQEAGLLAESEEPIKAGSKLIFNS